MRNKFVGIKGLTINAIPTQNPYTAPTAVSDDPYASRHQWRGRDIAIRGGLLPSRLWLIIGYTITIDENERFYTAQAASTEDFTWRFSHDGRMVEGHFETFGTQNAVRRKYNLTIDGDALGPNEVRLRGSFPFYVGVATIFAILAFGSIRYLAS